MGTVEQLQKYFDRDSVSDCDVGKRLDDIKTEMELEWQRYKQSRLYLHGETIADNRLDMILIYLLKKGLL